MRKRIMSLLLCLIMALSLLPATAVTALAAGATQSGQAELIGFAAGEKAGDAYIQNNGMTILDATGTGGSNPKYGDKVGQTATLSPYCPSYGKTKHPEYVYNDYNATAIIVEETGRRMLKGDTFKKGMTYRFTFQDTSWPVSLAIKGGGYLGELDASNFTINGAGAEVVKVERVAQQLELVEENSNQGFFYNVWIKINGDQNDYTVQYASNNVAVAGLSNTTTTTYPSKTGYAKEGTKITLTAAKVKDGYFFTGWKFTTDDGKFYTSKDYIQWYCNVTEYTSNEGGTDKATCSFRMGDKPLKVEALYGRPGSAGVGNVTFNNVKLWVMPPVKDATSMAVAVPEFDELGVTYQIGKVEWLEDNETGSLNYLGMDSNQTFDTANKCYTMRVVLKLKDGYAFNDENGITITINDKTYGTGTTNPLYNGERRTMPVTYNYDEANKSLAIYIPAGGDGVKTRLEDLYKPYAALNFVDEPSIDSVTVTDAGGHDYGTETRNEFTMSLEQGISYNIQVKVRVPKAIQDVIDKGLMQLQPQFRYLLQGSLTGENLWRGSQVTTATDTNGDTIYTYSTVGFGPVAGEKYMLVFGTNLVTTGTNAQRIAGNIITGTFNCVNTKITDGPTLTGSALKAGATSGPELTTSSTQYYIDTANTTAWDIPTTGAVIGKTYWTMLCLRPNSGYVFDPSHRYTPSVTLGGAAVRTNCAVAVDGSAMFLTVYATATHEHVMEYVSSGPDAHDYKCTLTGCTYKAYSEAHDWNAGVISESENKITYTCEKCQQTKVETYTAPSPGVETIYGFCAKVTTPKAGDTVGNAADWLAMRNNRNGKVQVAEAKWTEGGVEMSSTGTFEAGKTYTLTVTFEAASGCVIYYNPTSDVLMNSNGTAIPRTDDAANRTVTQSMTFKVKKAVDVTITLPDLKAGETLALPTYSVADDAVASFLCMAIVNNEDSYIYDSSSGTWDTTPPALTSDDVVTYGYGLTPKDGYKFANTTIVRNNAANLTDLLDCDGGFLASYTIPNANAISEVALTVSGYEYGKSVSAAAKGSDPANVTTRALSWSPSDTTFGAKAYTVTISIAPAAGYSFAEGCLFTVNGYRATYDAAAHTVTCELPALTAPHAHTFNSWTYLNDAVHYHSCTDCGAIEMKEHTWTKAGVTAATATAAGSVTYKCTCGAEKTEVIPKLTPDPSTGGSSGGGGTGGGGTGGGAASGRKSATTADPGILLYGVMALSSYTGTALLVRGRKKRG